jgi:hypothetical protein
LRAVCARCRQRVHAEVVPGGVSVVGNPPTSPEWARRAAIDRMGCHSHSRSKHGVFLGRRLVDFWEVWHKGEWRRLTYFRLPGDDGRHAI